MEAESRSPDLPRSRWVDLDSTHRREYWTDQLGRSESRLFDAVTMVGPLVDDVKKFLHQLRG